MSIARGLATGLLTACAASPEPALPTAERFKTWTSPEDTESNNHQVVQEQEAAAPTDRVVIIGAGLAGLAVAAELDDALVLEGGTTPGGRASCFGHASFFFVDTPEQADVDVDDHLELAIDNWQVLTGAEATPEAVVFLENSASVYDRMTGLGLSFSLGPESHPELPRRQHLVDIDGTELVDLMMDDLSDGVTVRTEAWVEELRVGPEGVTGVVVDGELIEADTVVIATGGYVGNESMLDQLLTLDESAWRSSADPFAQGDALAWAADNGWATTAPSSIGWLANAIGLPSEEGYAIKGSESLPPWIFINSNGERFHNEAIVWSVGLGHAISMNWPAWGVARWPDLLDFVYEGDREILEHHRETGLLVCSEDLGALAAEVGVDHEGLLDTLSSLRQQASSPSTDEFGRHSPAPVYQGGELCAFPPGREAAKSFGGLTVGEHGQVLSGDDGTTPIEGVFAVGEAAGMGAAGVGGIGGFDGSLTAVMWSGWRTGAYVAAQRDAN